MTKKVVTHLSLLKKLTKCKGKQRKTLLEEGGKSLQLCLKECAFNILKGNLYFSKDQHTKLKRYKKHIRDLSKKKTSQKRRLQIEQRGGFLPLLLAPVLGAVVSQLIKK